MKRDPDQTRDELESNDFHLTAIDPLPQTYLVPDHEREMLIHHPYSAEGLVYFINPSSVIPPVILNPCPGQRVLDLTAAPGGKTIVMAGMMKNRGQISAVENVKYRFHKMRANLEKNGVTNARLYLKDGTAIGKNCPEQFDKILLDAPCSTEGRFQNHIPATFGYWSERKIAEMNRKQRKLLFSAIRALKPGGDLVYSTCTFAPEENEEPVDRILQKFGDALTVVKYEITLKNRRSGLCRWRKKEFHPSIKNAIRILPDDIFEGFFICKIRKSESTL